MNSSIIMTYNYIFKVNEEHVGLVMEALSHRRAEITEMGPAEGESGRTKMKLTCPTRSVSGHY